MKEDLWLVIYNKKIGRYYTKYFKNKKDKEQYKRRVNYVAWLILIEDSDDIVYTRNYNVFYRFIWNNYFYWH